jgi:hypothetical protein
VLVNNTWLENPGDPALQPWPVHVIPNAQGDVKNASGMPDIMGKHYERGSALEVWYNTLVKPALPPSK